MGDEDGMETYAIVGFNRLRRYGACHKAFHNDNVQFKKINILPSLVFKAHKPTACHRTP